MSKKRGLSVEEKRSRLLDLFHAKKDFFLLKELERIAPKEKGIIAQSVKDVLQSLVDDDLVDTDKIGTSVYFWAFPSKASANRKRRLEQVEKSLGEFEERVESAAKRLKTAQKGREKSDKKDKVMEELATTKAELAAVESELQKFASSDPEKLKQLEEDTELSRQGANRWTDNIFALQAWIRRKFPQVTLADLNKQFGVPQDLDYIE